MSESIKTGAVIRAEKDEFGDCITITTEHDTMYLRKDEFKYIINGMITAAEGLGPKIIDFYSFAMQGYENAHKLREAFDRAKTARDIGVSLEFKVE